MEEDHEQEIMEEEEEIQEEPQEEVKESKSESFKAPDLNQISREYQEDLDKISDRFRDII